MEYVIVDEQSPNRLADRVNHNCENGWEPSGSMSVVIQANGEYYFFQPMVKKTAS